MIAPQNKLWLDPRLPPRFWSRIARDMSGHWLWLGPVAGRGYGVMCVDRRNVYTHRLAYSHLVAPIPGGLQLDHLCRVIECCNPVHLEPVTARENLMRGRSPSAAAAQATHCPQGHEYSGANLYVTASGHRACRACQRDRRRIAHRLDKGWSREDALGVPARPQRRGRRLRPHEVQELIAAYREGGASHRSLARRFGVGASTVARWIARDEMEAAG